MKNNVSNFIVGEFRMKKIMNVVFVVAATGSLRAMDEDRTQIYQSPAVLRGKLAEIKAALDTTDEGAKKAALQSAFKCIGTTPETDAQRMERVNKWLRKDFGVKPTTRRVASPALYKPIEVIEKPARLDTPARLETASPFVGDEPILTPRKKEDPLKGMYSAGSSFLSDPLPEPQLEGWSEGDTSMNHWLTFKGNAIITK